MVWPLIIFDKKTTKTGLIRGGFMVLLEWLFCIAC